ncbi:MAG TPA: hypothetical protein VIW24_25335 [Aldersonia sp.]
MSRFDPDRLDATAAALRPLLAVAEAQWREQYRLARSLPDQWHGTGGSEAVEALLDCLDRAERTLTRIRDAIDTLEAAAQVLRAIGTRLEAAIGEWPDGVDEAVTALREAAAHAVGQVGTVVAQALDPCLAEPEAIPDDPPQGDPPEGNPLPAAGWSGSPTPEASILVDPVVAQPDTEPRRVTLAADVDPAEPTLLQGNSARRASAVPQSPAATQSRVELAAVGPDDDAAAPILAEAGSW